MDPYCGTKYDIIPDVILPSSICIALATMIYPIYLYIRSYEEHKSSISTSIFFAVIIYFALLIFFYVDFFLVNIYWCSSGLIIDWCFNILFRSYHAQALMICSILFARFVDVFKETAFKISQCTIIVYIVIAVLTVTSATCGNILFYEHGYEQIGLLLIGLSALFYVMVMVLLNCLFIYKLIKVRKRVKNQRACSQDDNLVNVITKTSILSLASTVCTFAFLSLFTFRNVWNSVYYWVMVAILLMSDIYTNYLSILMSFKQFNNWYLCLCGCCDQKCNSFWERCINGRKNVAPPQELVLQTSHSGTGTNTSSGQTIHAAAIEKIINIPSRSPSSARTPPMRKIDVCFVE